MSSTSRRCSVSIATGSASSSHISEEGFCAFLRLRPDDPFDLALFVGRESAGTEPDRFPAIEVASLDDAVAQLRRRGVDVGEITETAIGRYVKLHDPERNVVEIHETTTP